MADEKEVTAAVETQATEEATAATEAAEAVETEPVAEAAETVEAAPVAETAEAVEAEPETQKTQEITAAEAAEEVEAAKDTSGKKTSTAGDKALTALGVVLCILLAPILIANLTMIVKSYTKSNDVPSFAGYCPFIILTDSMTPTIDSGDLVIDRVVTDPTEIRVGDIISFFDPASRSKSIVTHRVAEVTMGKDGVAFITKGDGNNTKDDAQVPADNVVGVYWFRIPGFGNVVMFMQSAPGLVVCVALPILLLIGYDAIRRRKYDKQQKADTEALLRELEELRSRQK